MTSDDAMRLAKQGKKSASSLGDWHVAVDGSRGAVVEEAGPCADGCDLKLALDALMRHHSFSLDSRFMKLRRNMNKS